jgi:hypothetical protein
MGHRALLLVVLIAVMVGLLGLALTIAAQTSRPSLAAAKRFDGYRLYYVGRRLRRLPLTTVLQPPESAGGRSWSFIYGDCTPPPGGACAPAPRDPELERLRPLSGALSP